MLSDEPEVTPYRRSLLRQKRSRETRERLVRAALHLWSVRGFDETTVEEISAEAGVGFSTFYYHFPSKDELISELTLMTARLADADIELDPTASLSLNLDRYIVCLASRVARSPKHITLVTLRRTIHAIEFVGGPSEDEVSLTSSLRRILNHAKDSGHLSAEADIDELSAVFTGMLMEGMLRWANETAPTDDLTSVLRFRAAVFLSSIDATHDATH
jgi:AcrR family transcriptional regulator